MLNSRRTIPLGLIAAMGTALGAGMVMEPISRTLTGIRFSTPSRSKFYPFSGARQDARHQRQGQRMVMVNGFEVMNRL